MYLGDFDGGEIEFPDYLVKFPVQSSDLLFFHTKDIKHRVHDSVGERISIIFFLHSTTYFLPGGTCASVFL